MHVKKIYVRAFETFRTQTISMKGLFIIIIVIIINHVVSVQV